MAEDGQNARGKLGDTIDRLIEYLRAGRIAPAEFCGATFELMRWAGGGDADANRACVALMPREILKLLADFVPYMPDGCFTPSFRRVVAGIKEELRSRGAPAEGETGYTLPKRDPAGLSREYWDGVIEAIDSAEDGPKKRRDALLRNTRNHVRALQAGDFLGPMDFCLNFFSDMAHAALKGMEDTWKACLELMPRNVLQLVCDYAEAAYKPIDYAIDFEEPLLGGGYDRDAERKHAEAPGVLRRLCEAVEEELRSRGGAVEGEVRYELPKRIPGDPPIRYWMYTSREPYTVDDLAARMARFLEEADPETRRKFEGIRIAPQKMPIHNERWEEWAWVVGRKGPQVLYYDHVMGYYLYIGWILSTGKVWMVEAAETLPGILKKWPVGPISPEKSDAMEVRAYGHLENTEATRSLLRSRIDYCLEQVDGLNKEREFEPQIVLACDTPPDPELRGFLEEIRRQVAKHRAQFKIVTGAFV